METRTAFAWALVVVLAVITWLLVLPFLSWLLATGILAVVLFPVYERLEARIGPRLSAALLTALVVGLVAIPLTVGVYAAVTRGAEFLQAVTETGAFDPLQQSIKEYTGVTVPLQSYAEQAADRFTDYVSARPSAVLSEGLHTFLGFLLLTFVLYYLLVDGREFVAWLKRMTPLEPAVRDELFEATDNMVWAVLKGHVLVAFVQGLVAGISLFVTGVPEALLLTAAMMVLALIPVVGVAPILGGAIIYLVVNGQPLSAAFVFVWGMTSVAITDDYFRAFLIERESEMHSAFIFVGILGGTYLFGAMGLFVGPILVGLFKTTVEVLGTSYGVIRPSEE